VYTEEPALVWKKKVRVVAGKVHHLHPETRPCPPGATGGRSGNKKKTEEASLAKRDRKKRGTSFKGEKPITKTVGRDTTKEKKSAKKRERWQVQY